MAYRVIGVTIGAVDANGQPTGVVVGNPSTPAAAAALAPATTALDAAMAVLVADGATPTQAHVTTANSALTTFETALTTYNTAVTALGANGNLVVMIDAATVITKNAFRAGLSAIVRAITGGSNLLT